MNNWEIESKLREKVDNWKFNSLEQEVSSLKRENQQLRETIGRCESKFQNYYEAISQITRVLIESEEFEDNEDTLRSIPQYL